ncbi:hypothetical protein GC167_10570 [bacterium]|nr:hypothetical protein [bacterium]
MLKAAVERMGGFEGQGKNRKIPKGAFFSTNEHGERLPLVFLPNRKGGDPVPVLKVRMRRNLTNAVDLHADQSQFVNPNNNHHILIYEDVHGEWQEEIVSFWEAVERKIQGLEVYRLPADGMKILYVLEENRFFKVHPKWFRKQKENYNSDEEVLVRVQNISSNDYLFRHVNAATRLDESEELRVSSLKRLKKVHPIEVGLNVLGKK